MKPKTLGLLLLLAVVVAGLWAAQRYWLGELKVEPGAAQDMGGLMEPVPEVALADASGKLIRLRDFQGKVLVINFWATWCLPCKLEIPFFNDVYNEYRAQGVEFIGISVDAGGWKDIEEFQKEVPIAYPVVLADEKTVEAFGGLSGLPVTIFVDRQGRIVYKNIGITDIDHLRANIQRLL
ncbi:MAG: TlpA family protein disulfide reductase [Terriglobia bacterium]